MSDNEISSDVEEQTYDLCDNNHYVYITIKVESKRDPNAPYKYGNGYRTSTILNRDGGKCHITNEQGDCIMHLLTHIMNNIKEAYIPEDEDEDNDEFTEEEKKLLATEKPEIIKHSKMYNILSNCRSILHEQYIDTIAQLSNDIRQERKRMKLNAILGMDDTDSEDDKPVCSQKAIPNVCIDLNDDEEARSNSESSEVFGGIQTNGRYKAKLPKTTTTYSFHNNIILVFVVSWLSCMGLCKVIMDICALKF